MDEYEKLEEDLQKLYEEYMLKFRNQAYLEGLLEDYNRLEQDKMEVHQKADSLNRILMIVLCDNSK